MESRVGRSVSGSRAVSVEIAEPIWYPPLTELALGLPMKIVRFVVARSRLGSTQPGRDGIAVAPMSDEWLQESAADSGKRGDLV